VDTPLLPDTYKLEWQHLGDIKDDTTAVFTFHMEVAPHHAGHIVPGGGYRAHFAVAAANAGTTQHCLEITFAGTWFDQEEGMYTDGIKMAFVSTT